jgi:CRISPR system Cascade subunit CasE
MHGSIQACFAEYDRFGAQLLGDNLQKQTTRGRILWRVDDHGKLASLYILSPVEPNINLIVRDLGEYTEKPCVTKYYAPFLQSLKKDQIWGFRLRGNPTHAVVNASRGNGRSNILGHVTAEQQINWMMNKAHMLGVEIIIKNNAPMLKISDRRVSSFAHANTKITLNSALFDGVLRVLDPNILAFSIINGVGRAKAYGCGLLTLAKPNDCLL